MDIKYFINTFIAVLAIIISAVVAYSKFREVEELRVVPERLIPLFEDVKTSQLVMPMWLQFTFINSGNTSLAVVGASASIGHDANQKVSPTEPCAEDASFDTDLEPFVLKQADVVVKKVTFTPNINFKDRIHKSDQSEISGIEQSRLIQSLALDLSEAMKESSQAIFCMRFDLATPSDPLAYGAFVLGRYEFNKPNEFGKLEDHTTGILITFPPQPNVIWRATRFIFN